MGQGDTTITIAGNIVADPELRYTPAGAPVCNFRVASTPRTFNKQTNQWEDGEAMFLTCNVWRQAAENAAQSLRKGLRVVVQGRLKARTFQTREGDNRTVFEVDVDDLGPSLLFATAQVERATGGSSQPQGNAAQGGSWPQQNAPQSNTTWQPQGGFGTDGAPY